MKPMNCFLKKILILLSYICIFSCGRQTPVSPVPGFFRITSEAELDSISDLYDSEPDNIGVGLSLLNYYASSGMMTDDALALSSKIYDVAEREGNDVAAHICNVYSAQAYVWANSLDSVSLYEASLKYVSDNDSSTFFSILANNTIAIYLMKRDMDYSGALKYFSKALQVAEKMNDVFNQSAVLCNISSIYLIRGDTSGTKYARRAFTTAKQSGSPYVMINSAITLADMMLLNHNYKSAISYADTAEQYQKSWGIMEYGCVISLIRASANIELGNLTAASDNLEEAEKLISSAPEDIKTRYYMVLGNYLDRYGSPYEAIRYFNMALSTPGCTYETRQKLYLKLSDIYSSSGEAVLALNSLRQYHKCIDSLSILQKERDFNALLIEYEKMSYEKQIAEKELTIERNGRAAIIVISILVVIAVISFSISFNYRRKSQMYHSLVERHQQYMEKEKHFKENMAFAESSDHNDEKERKLFHQIESIMSDEKVYCMKDISLERISDMLSTNRSYVSKVINKYSQMSFYNYINSKRIEEATRILSDVSDNTPLKVLSDRLGFNTISTFYRAFQKETGCPPSKYRDEIRKIKSENVS